MFDESYDVVVVGAGHAGCEAAHAAARMGLRTALYTMNADLIAQMSCNPAVGGIAKGHLVREIDALGGRDGPCRRRSGHPVSAAEYEPGPCRLVAARTGRQGALSDVDAPDSGAHSESLYQTGGSYGNCCLTRGGVVGIELLDGRRVSAKAVVLTTGTFLNGLIHIGEKQFTAGRSGEPASISLANCIRAMGFEWGRLKTGTPPRLDRQNDRLFKVREAGGRRRSRRHFRFGLAEAREQDLLLHHANRRGDSRHHPAEHGPFAAVQRPDSRDWTAVLSFIWKTKSSSLQTRIIIRSSWSPKASTLTKSM